MFAVYVPPSWFIHFIEYLLADERLAANIKMTAVVGEAKLHAADGERSELCHWRSSGVITLSVTSDAGAFRFMAD